MMAGLVDTNVHIQDPGRGDWEGFAAATKAAGLRRHQNLDGSIKLIHFLLNQNLKYINYKSHISAAGGFTTLVDMPIHSKPPITSTDSFFKKTAAANGKVSDYMRFSTIMA